ncbi:hypothetical protein STEG23_011842 [Scotinomys teguina]
MLASPSLSTYVHRTSPGQLRVHCPPVPMTQHPEQTPEQIIFREAQSTLFTCAFCAFGALLKMSQGMPRRVGKLKSRGPDPQVEKLYGKQPVLYSYTASRAISAQELTSFLANIPLLTDSDLSCTYTWLFETNQIGFLCATTLDVLELTLYNRLVLNSQRSACLCFLSADIKGQYPSHLSFEIPLKP